MFRYTILSARKELPKQSMEEYKKRWLRLDNAAKIYPAARTKRWNNMFRLSMTLGEEIDPKLLQQALDAVAPRFPSICVRLCNGLFWYYLEECDAPPKVMQERPCPCSFISFSELGKCAIRVIYYHKRIAVEFYHSVTDGTGGLIFLKTLVAEYVRRSSGAIIPCGEGVLDIDEQPHDTELEDAFERFAGDVGEERDGELAYMMTGTRESDCWNNTITGVIDVAQIRAVAKGFGVTITEYLAAVMISSIAELQARDVKNRKRCKPVKVLVPVNLRQFFETDTLRNFALFVSPGIDRRKGDYDFDEILRQVHHQIGYQLTKKNLGAKFTSNVRSEQNPVLKMLPLFIKNLGMKLIYQFVGEKTACICMSNLGIVKLPEGMDKYVERVDFVLGAQASLVNNCGIASYKGKMNICFTRTIVEPSLEREFFTLLRKHGVVPKMESNQMRYQVKEGN